MPLPLWRPPEASEFSPASGLTRLQRFASCHRRALLRMLYQGHAFIGLLQYVLLCLLRLFAC